MQLTELPGLKARARRLENTGRKLERRGPQRHVGTARGCGGSGTCRARWDIDGHLGLYMGVAAARTIAVLGTQREMELARQPAQPTCFVPDQ